jgi:hypothetical protein
VGAAVQELSAAAPAAQLDAQLQGAHVAFETAPAAADQVPAGHSVAFMEDSGQKAPGGHITGAPDAQKKPAGQGTQVSVRTRLL